MTTKGQREQVGSQKLPSTAQAGVKPGQRDPDPISGPGPSPPANTGCTMSCGGNPRNHQEKEAATPHETHGGRDRIFQGRLDWRGPIGH